MVSGKWVNRKLSFHEFSFSALRCIEEIFDSFAIYGHGHNRRKVEAEKFVL
jgi:hypothetical protein